MWLSRVATSAARKPSVIGYAVKEIVSPTSIAFSSSMDSSLRATVRREPSFRAMG
jgi:hypothetical protein